MLKASKIYEKLLAGSRNVRFRDFQTVLEAFGYHLDRINGSHHIYEHVGVPRPLNVQAVRGEAKLYQIRQFLRDVEEFDLKMHE